MEYIDKLVDAIREGDEDIAEEAAKEIVAEKQDLNAVIAKLTDVMAEIGKQFENFEIFLPEMIMCSDALMKAMEVFEPVMLQSGNASKKGTVVIGTAVGDMHEIGKNIVSTVLSADGFDVHDLGKNVPSMEFVKEAKASDADIIIISSLMTTTMPGATEVIGFLKENNMRDQVKVMVGGAPTSPEWAEKIGADGWSGTASEAVELANELLNA